MNIFIRLKFYQNSGKQEGQIDMILSDRNFQQKYQKQNMDLNMTFVDSV